VIGAAHDLAAGRTLGRACPVHPLRAGGKLPATEHGVLDATVDREQIEAWWRRWPEANIGLGLAGARLVVLDVEGAGKGFDPFATLARLEEAFGELPVSRSSITAGGGVHVLYGLAPGQSGRAPTIIADENGEVIEGCERRREGHYVVAPPSRRHDGALWRWANDAAVAPAPAWLCPPPPPPREIAPASGPQFEAGADGTRFGLVALAGEVEEVARTTRPGQRHGQVYYSAARLGHLVGSGHLDPAAVERRLIDAAARALGEEWPARRDELCRTVRDGIAAGRLTPRGPVSQSAQERTRVAGPRARPAMPAGPRWR
jgi:putative DNA primase/helicase